MHESIQMMILDKEMKRVCAGTDRGVVSTRLLSTLLRLVHIIFFFVVPVLDRLVWNVVLSGIGKRPDVLAD